MAWKQRGLCVGLGASAFLVATTWLVYFATQSATAQGEKAEAGKKHEEIIRPIEHLAKCYNERDAKGFAAAWTEKAEYIDEDSGERFEGRAAIVEEFADAFGKKAEVRLEIDIANVRPLGDGAAVVDGIARIIKVKSPTTRSKFLALLVRQGDQWLIDNLRENRIESDHPNAEMLEPLAWMNGVWKSQQGDREITMECGVVANGNFRSHRFHVKNKDEIEHEGTQVIGWDAVKKRMRSWVFSSDGSFAEGVVENNGDAWTFRVAGALPSGEMSSATQIVTRKDATHFTFQSVARSIGTSALPDVAEITLTKTDAKKE